jgi:hypothetical protein
MRTTNKSSLYFEQTVNMMLCSQNRGEGGQEGDRRDGGVGASKADRNSSLFHVHIFEA